jgi:hypothetical protein
MQLDISEDLEGCRVAMTIDIYNMLMGYVVRDAAGDMLQEVTINKASFRDGYVAVLQDL